MSLNKKIKGTFSKKKIKGAFSKENIKSTVSKENIKGAAKGTFNVLSGKKGVLAAVGAYTAIGAVGIASFVLTAPLAVAVELGVAALSVSNSRLAAKIHDQKKGPKN